MSQNNCFLTKNTNKVFSRYSFVVVLLLAGLFKFTNFVSANEQTIGDITIHYSAFNSTSIPSEVAHQYSITRSNKQGLINITVMKNNKPVIANIFGHGKNLLGQLKELSFREIKEKNAIYYIASFNFNHSELISFNLQVQAEKTGKLIPLSFKQELFYQ